MHYEQAKSILSARNGMNLYRGCQHGCIYCDSRSGCYQMRHVFEDIAVKENALTLLEEALKRKRRPCMIGTGSMTDPYMPLEAQLGMTRGALERIRHYGFGAAVLTKSPLVLRDLELLQQIHSQSKAVVQMTLTTCDDALCRLVEPNVAVTSQRVEALKRLHRAGIPTVVWFCPILPFLNDTPENVRGIVARCAEAGVMGIIQFGMGMTLREGSREYYYAQLDHLFPGLKERYQQIYGNAYHCPSPREKELSRIFHRECERYGILHENDRIFSYLYTFRERLAADQLSLFP